METPLLAASYVSPNYSNSIHRTTQVHLKVALLPVTTSPLTNLIPLFPFQISSLYCVPRTAVLPLLSYVGENDSNEPLQIHWCVEQPNSMRLGEGGNEQRNLSGDQG